MYVWASFEIPNVVNHEFLCDYDNIDDFLEDFEDIFLTVAAVHIDEYMTHRYRRNDYLYSLEQYRQYLERIEVVWMPLTDTMGKLLDEDDDWQDADVIEWTDKEGDDISGYEDDF